MEQTSGTLQNGLQLAMDEKVRIPTNRRCEVRIKRGVQGVMVVFSNIKHSRAEIFGAVGGLEGQ